MLRYYKTPNGQLLEVDREVVDIDSFESAVQVSVAFGEVLYTTEGRVPDNATEDYRAQNAIDAWEDDDFEVALSWVQDQETEYNPLFAEAEAWIMKTYPGTKRSHEDEAVL